MYSASINFLSLKGLSEMSVCNPYVYWRFCVDPRLALKPLERFFKKLKV